ncbi:MULTISPECIES: DUF262 domain-containing protein [Rhodomicrobium]|uniref:DUF262 domain-containing protein n=1 Tax=Rhodomicrobium TaxID=1068 RepID=UPI000B4B5554|nr:MULTISPECIES: DUF262 domain-containing protein [Rhodomicrobium]
MTTSISSQVISLGSLLRCGDSYVVPPYQRNYAWDEGQFGVFWFDISKTFTGAAPEYFLGSVVINNSQAPEHVVIDGQQRLITTSVLLSALRSHLKSEGLTAMAASVEDFLIKSAPQQKLFKQPCLVLNKTDKGFYENHIFHARPLAEMQRLAEDEHASPSNRLLAECFCFMHRRIGEMRDGGLGIEAIADTIVGSLNERVFVIRIDVKDDYNAFLLFETLNDRGLELSEADLLKNHLFAASRDRLGETQRNWEVMEQDLGSERLIKFVRHHWLSTRGPIGERGLYSDIKAAIATPEDVAAYSESLCDASSLYAALSDPRHHLWGGFPNQQQPAIRNLVEAIEILRPEQLFIVLLAALEVDKRGFLELTRMLVNFTFRYSTICNLSPSAILQPFIGAARDIRETGAARTEELFKKHLATLYPDDSQFHSAFSRKVIRSNAQARYVLARINDHLSAKPSMRTEGDRFATDLEHILPKRHNGSWETSRRDFPGGIDKYVYRLGNMTLISAELNGRLGNADFETKKKVFDEDCLEITQKVLSAEKWTAEEIKSRQNWLASLACKIWRYPG